VFYHPPNPNRSEIQVSNSLLATAVLCAAQLDGIVKFWITNILCLLQAYVYEQANFWGCEGFCPNFPRLARKYSKENDLQIEKHVCTLILGAIFVKSKYIQGLYEGIHKFCPNFYRFCPDFR